MNWWELYLQWLNNSEGCKTFVEYYNLKLGYWVRESKQRNYQRNNDIIYHDTPTKRNKLSVKYEVIPLEFGQYYFDGSYLKYRYNDLGYNTDLTIDRVRPFGFITMWVNDKLELTAQIPNIILDAEFNIDNNGNLTVKYG